MKNCTITVDLAGLGSVVERVYGKTLTAKDRALCALTANNFKISELAQSADTLTVQAKHGGDPIACAGWANNHFRLDGSPRITITLE